MCIDTVEILFGIADGQISSNFHRVICPAHAHIFNSGQLGTCIDMKESLFGIANGQISSMFDRVICP